MKYILPALLFSFVCSAGWFCAWIGGVEPFTQAAGLISAMTIILASFVALAASNVKL